MSDLDHFSVKSISNDALMLAAKSSGYRVDSDGVESLVERLELMTKRANMWERLAKTNSARLDAILAKYNEDIKKCL